MSEFKIGEYSKNQTWTRKSYGESNRNALFLSYKTKAKKRKLLFELTIEQFTKFTQKNCFYCNKIPSQIKRQNETYGEYVYNGIDRKNNNLGYTLENCVSCCKRCNIAKNNMSEWEFLQWLLEIQTHYLSKH